MKTRPFQSTLAPVAVAELCLVRRMKAWRIALIAALIVAGSFFCIYGGFGYVHLLAFSRRRITPEDGYRRDYVKSACARISSFAGWLSIQSGLFGGFCISIALLAGVTSVFRRSPLSSRHSYVDAIRTVSARSHASVEFETVERMRGWLCV